MALTTTYQLKTFKDIYTAVLEELKIQSTDTTALNRVKRDINIVYLEEVVPFAQWKWLRGTFDATVYAAISAGTATATQGNNTVTLTVAISSPKTGWLFGIVGYNEVYRIANHTAGSTTVTLEVPYTGATLTTGSYKIWTDEIFLPSFVRETFSITHDFQDQALENCGLQKYRQYVAALPRAEGRPNFYTTNTYVDPVMYAVPTGMPAISTRASSAITKTLVFASDVSNYVQQGDRIRITGCTDSSYNGEFVISTQVTTAITYTAMVGTYEATTTDTAITLQKMQPSSDTRRAKRVQVYPAIFQSNTTLHIDYIREVVGLADDTDEPLMPIGDRSILLNGALNRAWSRERNPEEAKRNFDLFTMKLSRMAGKMDDSIDQPILRPNKIYLGSKRMAQRQNSTRSGLPEGWGGGAGSGNVVTGTPNRVSVFGADGVLVASSITTTILNYLSGVGSSVHGDTDIATITHKTIDGNNNILLNIPNSALASSGSYVFTDGSRAMTGYLTTPGIYASSGTPTAPSIAFQNTSRGTYNSGLYSTYNNNGTALGFSLDGITQAELLQNSAFAGPFSATCITANGSTLLTNLSTTNGIRPGMIVTGTNVPGSIAGGDANLLYSVNGSSATMIGYSGYASGAATASSAASVVTFTDPGVPIFTCTELNDLTLSIGHQLSMNSADWSVPRLDLINGGNNFNDVMHVTASSRIMDGAGIMFGSVSGANGMAKNTYFLNDARSYNQVVTTGNVGPASDPFRITGVANSSGVLIGSWVVAAGVTLGTTVTAIDGTNVTMSSSASASSAGANVTFRGVPSGSIVDRMFSFGQPGEVRPHTFNGAIFASSAVNASNISGSNTGDLLIAPVGSSPNSSAGSISSQSLTLQPANNTNPGVVTTAAQSFAGAKTFTSALSVVSSSAASAAQINLGDSGTGFFRKNVNQWGFNSNGVEVGHFDTAGDWYLGSVFTSTIRVQGTDVQLNSTGNITQPTAIYQGLVRTAAFTMAGGTSYAGTVLGGGGMYLYGDQHAVFGSNVQIFTGTKLAIGANSNALVTIGSTASTQTHLMLGSFNIRGTLASSGFFTTSLNSAITGQANLATNATDGFLYFPASSGVPIGTPTLQNGFSAAVVDTTDNRLYWRSSSAWKRGIEEPQTLTLSSSAVAWNMDLSANAKIVAPASNFTLSNPTNIFAGNSGLITITQDSTGSRLITYGTNYKFPAGTAFTLSTSAGAVDNLSWYSPDGANVHIVGQLAFR